LWNSESLWSRLQRKNAIRRKRRSETEIKEENPQKKDFKLEMKRQKYREIVQNSSEIDKQGLIKKSYQKLKHSSAKSTRKMKLICLKNALNLYFFTCSDANPHPNFQKHVDSFFFVFEMIKHDITHANNDCRNNEQLPKPKAVVNWRSCLRRIFNADRQDH